MTEATHTQSVRDLFAAFQRGDGDGVQGRLDEDVVWSTPGPPQVPYAGTYRGREEVARFLSTLDAELDYEHWEPRELAARRGQRVLRTAPAVSEAAVRLQRPKEPLELWSAEHEEDSHA